ncbi:hypothetical protein K439DRAFT_189959 [Ramaria rubella]|nr:hypothetical protein K439DRAFT_189959 [Ramaria rubella]
MAGITVLATFQKLHPWNCILPPLHQPVCGGLMTSPSISYVNTLLLGMRSRALGGLANFYRLITESIFAGTFRYDNVYGRSRFVMGPSPGIGGQFRLDEYFRQLEAGQTGPINCYDMAGIVQIVLSLFRNYSQGFWIFMRVYGWIPTSNLKGFGSCNNPFFGNTLYDPLQIAPVNPPQIPFPPGFRRRSNFENHAFILASTSTPNVTCVLDTISGPYIGNQNLDMYINTALRHITPPFLTRVRARLLILTRSLGVLPHLSRLFPCPCRRLLPLLLLH